VADDQKRPGDDGRQSEKQAAEGEPRHPPKALVGGEKDDNGKEGKGEDGKEEEAKSQDARGEKDSGHGKGAGQRGPKGPWTRVRQNFYGNFHAPNSTFGSSAGAAGGDEQGGRVRDEGPVEEAVIAGIVRAYAKPVCYEEAQRVLRDKHVVILIGTAGSGRRAGAIVMLDGVRVTDKPLVRINPSITIEKLAGRSFDEGVGYLISEKFDDKISEKSDDKIAPELAEFHWDALCHKVRKAKAHLVVTVGAGPIPGVPDAIGQVPWQRPDAADALRAHLGASRVADDVVQKAAEALGTNYSLADIGPLARRILAGEDIGELLDELRGGDQQAVAGWLDSVDAAIPAVLEVATLAFVLGVPERIFEDEVAGLKLQLADFAPEIDTGSKEAKVEIDLRFRQLRKKRADHRLITVTQVPVPRNSGSIAVRHVDFRAPAYRQCVIAELWSSLDREFWSGMRRWLHAIAAAEHGDSMWHDDLMNSAAFGLALLALVAPDEVIDSYILPWTDEDASETEQTMAVFIVWWMSMLDRVAPLALRIAILWAGEGTPTQRRLAAYAFSGELGAHYPVEATKRLSQLADQQEPLAAQMFAQLFATLATQGADAVVVLRELGRRMEAKKDRPVTVLVLEAVVELLAVRDDHSARPAVAAFLKDNPSRAADIGPLWARVLYMRPWRGRAIEALVATVGAMAKPTVGVKAQAQASVASDDLARALGAAIGRELPQLERAPLVYEIRRWVEEERRREKRDRKPRGDGPDSPTSAYFDELLEKLLNAIAHPSLRELDA
jgi:hypothetical protein